MEITKELIVEQIDKLIDAHWHWTEFWECLNRIFNCTNLYDTDLYKSSQEQYAQLIFKMLIDFSPVDFEPIKTEAEETFFDMLSVIPSEGFFIFPMYNGEIIKVRNGEDIYNIFNKPEYWGIF